MRKYRVHYGVIGPRVPKHGCLILCIYNILVDELNFVGRMSYLVSKCLTKHKNSSFLIQMGNSVQV